MNLKNTLSHTQIFHLYLRKQFAPPPHPPISPPCQAKHCKSAVCSNLNLNPTTHLSKVCTQFYYLVIKVCSLLLPLKSQQILATQQRPFQADAQRCSSNSTTHFSKSHGILSRCFAMIACSCFCKTLQIGRVGLFKAEPQQHTCVTHSSKSPALNSAMLF